MNQEPKQRAVGERWVQRCADGSHAVVEQLANGAAQGIAGPWAERRNAVDALRNGFKNSGQAAKEAPCPSE